MANKNLPDLNKKHIITSKYIKIDKIPAKTGYQTSPVISNKDYSLTETLAEKINNVTCRGSLTNNSIKKSV
jgi:hypothetical protein